MKTVYLFRHQRAGIVADYVFSDMPTAVDVDVLVAKAESLHGEGWHTVMPVPLLGPGELTELAAATPATETPLAGLGRFASLASGTVTNPGGK